MEEYWVKRYVNCQNIFICIKMKKLDLVKEFKSYYSAKPKPEMFEVGPVRYLSILGKGDPSGQQFADKIKTLYSVVYPLKFTCKAMGQDFVVAKLEGLWWFNLEKYAGIGMVDAPVKVPRQEWEYRLLIRIPDFISEELVNETRQKVKEKKPTLNVEEVQVHQTRDGIVVQMLHIGPFSNELETLKQMQYYMELHQLQYNGFHHEIYLSDFKKTAPEKLKTILREPVK